MIRKQEEEEIRIGRSFQRDIELASVRRPAPAQVTVSFLQSKNIDYSPFTRNLLKQTS